MGSFDKQSAILLSQHFRLSLLQIKSHLQISPTSSTFSSKLIKMADILAGNNVEEEFMWSCTLTGSNKEYSWDPAVTETGVKEGEEEGEKEALMVKPGHRLLIKSAILMPNAKKDEVTVIQIESEGYNKQKVIVPIVAMKGGSDLQKYVALLVPGPAKLKIIRGEGPINLVGSHVVDYFGFKDEDDEEDSEEEEEGDTENEGMETEEVNEKGDKKIAPSKDGKKATPTKEDSGKKASPAKEESEKGEKKTPTKEVSKKRKASSEANSAEKKAKS